MKLLPLFMATAVLAHAASSDAPVRLVVQMDLPVVNAQFTGLLVAEERGWYREAGLVVELVKSAAATGVAAVVGRRSKPSA